MLSCSCFTISLCVCCLGTSLCLVVNGEAKRKPTTRIPHLVFKGDTQRCEQRPVPLPTNEPHPPWGNRFSPHPTHFSMGFLAKPPICRVRLAQKFEEFLFSIFRVSLAQKLAADFSGEALGACIARWQCCRSRLRFQKLGSPWAGRIRGTVRVWMVAESISHHLETMGNHSLLQAACCYLQGNHTSRASLRWCEMDFVHPQCGWLRNQLLAASRETMVETISLV